MLKRLLLINGEAKTLIVLALLSFLVGSGLVIHTYATNQDLDKEVQKVYEVFDHSGNGADSEDGSQQQIMEKEVEKIYAGVHNRKVIGSFWVGVSGILLLAGFVAGKD
jgi:hypothetical protein